MAVAFVKSPTARQWSSVAVSMRTSESNEGLVRHSEVVSGTRGCATTHHTTSPAINTAHHSTTHTHTLVCKYLFENIGEERAVGVIFKQFVQALVLGVGQRLRRKEFGQFALERVRLSGFECGIDTAATQPSRALRHPSDGAGSARPTQTNINTH
jgi:hypothetical protein